ncbi:MAG: two-component regulator propeller domain-containing protein [Candidatus Cloacimonetes bacterium]|nr:two-component regulator propeller domain-containing protein [Candidatus Cloacimonadota bacterium]
MLRRFLILVLMIASLSAIEAENDQWRLFRSGGDIINCIAQEGEYLWLGTWCGLIRFNTNSGEKVYYTKINTPMTRDGINALVIDNNGIKWVGSQAGLFSFDGDTWQRYYVGGSFSGYNNITALTLEPGGGIAIAAMNASDQTILVCQGREWHSTITGELPVSFVNSIAFDSQNQTWVGSNQGLVRISGQTITYYTESNSNIPSNHVTTVAVDQQDRIWVGTYMNGMARYSGMMWTHYTPANLGLPSYNINKIKVDSSNRLWIGTWHGLASFDTELVSYTPDNSGLAVVNVKDICETAPGMYWLGLHGAGIQSFDGENWQLYDTENNKLPSIRICAVAVDSQDGIWFGAGVYGGGISYFDKHSWQSYNHLNSDFPNTKVNALTVDTEDKLWVGTEDGLIHFDGESFTHYTEQNSPLQGNQITALHTYQDGSIFIGYNGGFMVYALGNWQTFNYENSPVPSYAVTDFSSKMGEVWFSLWGGGIGRLTSQGITIFNTSNSDLPSNYIQGVAVNELGEVWAISYPVYDYCTLLRLNGNSWQVIDHQDMGFYSNFAMDLCFDGNDDLWVACGEGILHYDRFSWELLPPANGLQIGGDTQCIAVDSRGNKWMGFYWDGAAVYNEAGYLPVAQDSSSPTPQKLMISSYPNPFNPSTTIAFTLPEPGTTEVFIYNLKGQRVRTLESRYLSSGTHQLHFNGIDDSGKPLSSGIYFARIRHRGRQQTHKLMLMK